MVKKGNQATTELLVQWEGSSEEDALYVELEQLRKQQPELMGEFF